MTNAPERIWAVPAIGGEWGDGLGMYSVTAPIKSPRCQEYTRTDLYTAAIAERDALRVQVMALKGALGDISNGVPEWPNDDAKELQWCRNRATQALKGTHNADAN